MNHFAIVLQKEPQAVLKLSLDGSLLGVVRDGFGGEPDGVQIDVENGKIYWTNMGLDIAEADGTIECSDLDGGNHAVLVGGGAVVTPKQAALDVRGGHIYWCDREGMRVMRARMDGSDVTTLIEAGRYPEQMSDETRHCVGIAFDPHRRLLYWSQKGPKNGGRGAIYRIGIDRPSDEFPLSPNDAERIIDCLPEPIDLALDHRNQLLYWTDRSSLEGGDSLNRIAVGENENASHQILAEGLDEGIGVALSPDNRHIFVTDLGGSVRVGDLDGLPGLRTMASFGPLTGIAVS
jgi:DNA-binding beta-propeller fold protein YncE